MKKRVIVVCGPTGVGKTRCAVSLALRFGGEIVGADAVQVYRGLTIGSAKPTVGELSAVHHHLIDVVDPDENFDAAVYARMARRVVDDMMERGAVPIIAGGTGLYIRAVLNGIFESPPADPGIRSWLKQRMSEVGTAGLHEALTRMDPFAARRLHPNDAARIVRAMEVVLATGRPISEFHRDHKFSDSPYLAFKIGLFMEREALYERINQRVDRMIEEGFVQEVRGLVDSGYGTDLKSMQSLGYRHIAYHLAGGIDLGGAITAMKRDHRRYAKRQMTWFRADTAIHWFRPEDILSIMDGVSSFLCA